MSKTELYKEKLKERELYSNNVLDTFTENGGGAPLRNKDGSIMTKRRAILNRDYEDYYLNQRNRNQTPLSYNYSQQINSLENINNINNINMNTLNGMDPNNNNNYPTNNFYQTLPVRSIDNNNINNMNLNANNNNIENNNIENETRINDKDYQNQNFGRRPRSQINYNNNIYRATNNQFNYTNSSNFRELRDYDHYEGTGVILKENNLDEDKRIKYRNLREEWLKEIEERKEREALRKRREKEEDYRLEEKYMKEMNEIKERERSEKIKLNDNLREINNTNLRMMEDNKKKNLNQNEDYINNNNINYNQEMNINNMESFPPQENGMPLNQTNSQNFGILKESNNNTELNIINNYSNMNEFDLDSNPQDIDDNINIQIAKLRDDVNSQYIEMSNLFGKLKMDVIEANQLRNEAEKELQYIRKELIKNKMANLAYDAELNQVLEKHAPYNNLHINVKDVDPLYSLRNVKKNIQTTSNMIYNTDMVNEQNVNRVKQLSALAQAGQSLIGLKAESEFIPINNPDENGIEENNNINNNIMMENDPKNNIAISKTGYKNLESESYPVYQDDNNNNKENEVNNEPKILDDYMNKGEYSNMYKQLVDIANINHEMGAENKLKTMNKDYEIDYNEFNKQHSKKKKKIINKFDQLLNEIN